MVSFHSNVQAAESSGMFTPIILDNMRDKAYCTTYSCGGRCSFAFHADSECTILGRIARIAWHECFAHHSNNLFADIAYTYEES